MRRIVFLVSTIFVYLLSSAQWTDDTSLNTSVATLETEVIQSISTTDGRTYVAFWHNVPSPENFEMRLQLLDTDGSRLFGDEGMLVNGTVPMSTFTVVGDIAIDAQDNVYIGFNGTDGGNPAYVHKISTAGDQLWGEDGLHVGSGFDVKILPLSSGEVIVGWLPGSEGVFQKYSSTGVAIWASPITIVSTSNGNNTSAGEMAEYSDGSLFMMYHDRGGFGPASTPFVQRYNTDGVAQWSPSVQLSSSTSLLFNRRYSLSMSGDAAFIGYSGGVGATIQSFVQRVNADGSTPWGAGGVDVDTQSSNVERVTSIALEQGSDEVWAICEVTDGNQTEIGEYVQKFDKTSGTRLLGDNAVEVYSISAENFSHRGELQVNDGQPMFILSEGYSNGVTAYDLSLVTLNADGSIALPTLSLATNLDGVKSRVHLGRPAGGQMIASWVEDRTGQNLAYAQRITLTPSSLGEAQQWTDFNLFPNPSSGLINYSLSGDLSGQLNISTLDAQGRLILSQVVQLVAGQQNQTIDFSDDLAPGNYLLRIDFEGESISRPFVIVE